MSLSSALLARQPKPEATYRVEGAIFQEDCVKLITSDLQGSEAHKAIGRLTTDVHHGRDAVDAMVEFKKLLPKQN